MGSKEKMDDRCKQKISSVEKEDLYRSARFKKWWKDTFQQLEMESRRPLRLSAHDVLQRIGKNVLQSLKSQNSSMMLTRPTSAKPFTPNPYLKYFDRRNIDIWKSVQIEDLPEIKIDRIIRRIAEDFIDWFYGKNKEREIHIQNLIEMFSLDLFSMELFSYVPSEMASVPEETAIAEGTPQLGKHYRLRQELKRDELAYRSRPKTVAFSKNLPANLRVVPNRNDYFKKFLNFNAPVEIESMAVVFEGITNLSSTRKYIRYLKQNHPKIPIPKYLNDKLL